MNKNKINTKNIFKALDVLTNEKLKRIQFDYTKKGKVKSINNNECIVVIDGENNTCKLNGLTVNVNDIVLVRILNNDYSNKIIDKNLSSPSGGTGGDLSAINISITDTANNFTSTNVEEALTELFTNVSDGKDAIATAITDKGGNALGSDTFTQLANAITVLPGGVAYATGRTKAVGGQLAVSGLSFIPKIVIVSARNNALYVKSGAYNVDAVVGGYWESSFTPGTATWSANGFTVAVGLNEVFCNWMVFG